jgi:cysteine desulfurase/selenocysteine lyase
MLVDGCQGIVHMQIDVQDLDVDFYAFSGHKLYGPTAFGVLYGKKDVLADMPPYQGGGDMIASVSFEKTIYAEPPHRFEAGTPPIIEAIGFGAALDYVNGWGMDQIIAHEEDVHRYAQDRLKQLPGITVYGNAPDKQGIVSFLVDGIHAHDVGTIVDRCGVAVRVGHHCAEPLMQRFGVEAMARASFGMYNTKEDVDALLEAVKTAQEFFG